MADMRSRFGGDGTRSGTGSDRADRAQLILITGLTLAVLLVAVVLLLNTVIYTENLATRGVDAGGTEAAEFREGTATDVGTMLTRTDWSTADPDEFEADLAAYASATREHRVRDGVVATVDGDPVDGSFVAQAADGESRALVPDDEYVDESGANAGDEWTLVEDATRTRAYTAELSVTETIENETLVDDDAFRLTVTAADGSDEWRLYVYRVDGGEVTVRVDGEEYAPDGSGGHDVRLDLTAGTVDGDEWDALVWADGVEDDASRTGSRTEYDVTYANGDTVEGGYGFVVDTRSGVATAAPDRPLNDIADESPYAVDAVYGVDVTVGHHTPELRYEDRVRVAPGERDD